MACVGKQRSVLGRTVVELELREVGQDPGEWQLDEVKRRTATDEALVVDCVGARCPETVIAAQEARVIKEFLFGKGFDYGPVPKVSAGEPGADRSLACDLFEDVVGADKRCATLLGRQLCNIFVAEAMVGDLVSRGRNRLYRLGVLEGRRPRDEPGGGELVVREDVKHKWSCLDGEFASG